MRTQTLHSRLLFLIVSLSYMVHIVTSNCRTIKGELNTEKQFSDVIRLSEKAVKNLNISFKVSFHNRTTCCPIMNIRATLDKDPPTARTCFNQARNLIANKHYIALSNTYGKKCERSGTSLICSDTQAFVYLQPRHWFVSFGYECGAMKKSLSLQYEFCLTEEVTLDCNQLTVGNAMCNRNIDDKSGLDNHVLFPNRFGHRDSAEAFEYRRYIDVFSTLSDIEAQCYQHINYFTCKSLYPECTSPKPKPAITHPSNTGGSIFITADDATTESTTSSEPSFNVPCRRMCQELFLGCKAFLDIRGIIDCENYPEGLPPSTPCTYLEVNCSTAGLDIMNGTFDISGHSLNDTAIYSCENGLEIVGNKTLTCLPSGHWSSEPPDCKPRGPTTIPHLDIIICFTVAGVILITAGVTLYIFRRHRRICCCCKPALVDIDMPLPVRQKIFVSSCADNRDDVENFLNEFETEIPQCEYLHYHRDFIAGDRIMDDIHRGVWESKGMINFITQDFIDSPWCKTEFTQGCSRHRRDKDFPFIAVLNMTDHERHQLQNVPADMKAYLAQNVYLLRNEPAFWNKLSMALLQGSEDERPAEMLYRLTCPCLTLCHTDRNDG